MDADPWRSAGGRGRRSRPPARAWGGSSTHLLHQRARVLLEAAPGHAEQLAGDGEIDRGGLRLHRPEECRELEKTLRRVDPRPVPPEQRPDRKRVTKIMDARRRSSEREQETKVGPQPAEHPSDLLAAQATACTDGEEGRVALGPLAARAAQGEIAVQRLPPPRSEGSEAGLAELRLADGEQLPLAVEILEVEAADFSDP